MPESLERIAALRSQLHENLFVQVDGGDRGGEHRRRAATRGADLLVAGSAIFGREDYPRGLPAARARPLPKPLERALELAERGRGTTHPNPVVGAVVVAGRRGRRRGLARAGGRPARRGRRPRGSRRARPRRDALRHARALRAPRPHAALRRRGPRRRDRPGRRRRARPESRDGRRGFERLREARRRGGARRGRARRRARRQNEAWRTWIAAAAARS